MGSLLIRHFQNFYAHIPWTADVPRYKCTKFKVVCLQMTLMLTMSLLALKQGFYKAMCTCRCVLNVKLIMSSNDKNMRVCAFTAKSHTMHYNCPKRHMYQMPDK